MEDTKQIHVDALRPMSIARLPAEILEEVVLLLPVEHAISLLEITRHSPEHAHIARSCERRTSVKQYIEHGLGNSDLILATMSRNFVYLSGSRSLDFFVPGSTTENSDWDFYVPNDSMHVSAFLADMENIGVMWYSPLQEIVRLMEGEKGGYVRVEKDAWEDTFCTDSLGQAAIALGFRLELGPNLSPFQDEMFEYGDSSFVGIQVDCVNRLITECTAGYPTARYPNVDSIEIVINGSLPRGDKVAKIQLIVENRNHPLQPNALLDFHSSCVQSYISAHVACHFYGKLASAHATYVWAWHIKKKNAEAAAQKYQDRGFKPAPVPHGDGNYKLRLADGEQATLLAPFNFTDASPALVAEYEHWARIQRWEQFYNNNKSLYPPPRDDFSMKATEEVKKEILHNTEPHRMTFLWNHAKMERFNKERPDIRASPLLPGEFY